MSVEAKRGSSRSSHFQPSNELINFSEAQRKKEIADLDWIDTKKKICCLVGLLFAAIAIGIAIYYVKKI